jgi:hypothetical protein
MKKKKTLHLEKETLRALQPNELSLAGGGTDTSGIWCSAPCPTQICTHTRGCPQ